VQDYLLDYNVFLQVAPVSSSSGQPFKNIVLLTVSRGTHMLVNIGFSKAADNTYTFSSLDIQATFNKYGAQQVLNWVDLVLPQTSIGCFGVMYYNTERQFITLALYELPNNLSSSVTIDFKTSVNQTISCTVYEFQPLMFRSTSSQ